MRNRKHGPVVYIDPTTGKPKCDPTDCVDKLIEYFEFKETNYKWVGGPVFHKYFYSICKECNTRTITASDKRKTDQSYKIAIDNNGVDPEVKEMVNGGNSREKTQ